MTQNKTIIGLTGGSGAGKGEAAKVLAMLSSEIICADSVAHQVILKGKPAHQRIVDAFGDVVDDQGEIDRRKLREIVFANKAQLKLLEDCVQDFIIAEILSIAASLGEFVVIDAPLLFQSGLDKICDVTLGIFAPLDVRIQRICERDGLTRHEAMMRINNQMTDLELEELVEYKINNDGTLEELDEKIHNFYDAIFAGSVWEQG